MTIPITDEMIERAAALESAVRSLVDVLSDARSSFISGSATDLEWDKRRDSAIADARAALEAALKGGE
jgi:MoxR-like ATPase